MADSLFDAAVPDDFVLQLTRPIRLRAESRAAVSIRWGYPSPARTRPRGPWLRTVLFRILFGPVCALQCRSMTDYVAAMKIGLRVLKAISDRSDPASDDVEELRRLAPEFSNLCIDDLAFEIILRAASRGQIRRNIDRRRNAAA